jgi:hypothetical protein
MILKLSFDVSKITLIAKSNRKAVENYTLE